MLRHQLESKMRFWNGTKWCPFLAHNTISPLVTPSQNFDDLLVPETHSSRSLSDSYYINHEWMLRTHTSAHQLERMKHGDKAGLITGDVYRRDEIDRTHYPVFHQMEGFRIFDDIGDATLDQEVAEMLKKGRCVHEEPNDTTSALQHHHASDDMRLRVHLLSQHLKLTLENAIRSLFDSFDRSQVSICFSHSISKYLILLFDLFIF